MNSEKTFLFTIRWKLFPLLIAFSTPLYSATSLPKSFKYLPETCQKTFTHLIGQVAPLWTLRPGKSSSGSVRMIYQTTTYKLHNTLWRLEKRDHLIFLTKRDPLAVSFYKFDPKKSPNCGQKLMKTQPIDTLSNQANDPTLFTDLDLKKLLQKSTKGVIYLWSPHMPYSIGNFYPLQRVTKKLGIPVTILMDPHAHKQEIALVTKQFSLAKEFTRKNASEQLFSKGSALHYPNFFFYKEGRIKTLQLFGAKGEEAITEIITKHL